jgi:sterol desaturase/sphingolipid hydroxylase (fatty acid hydroxylase superfamily)
MRHDHASFVNRNLVRRTPFPRPAGCEAMTDLFTVLIALAASALIEQIIPFVRPTNVGAARFRTNVILTAMTFATNFALNGLILLGLVALNRSGYGVRNFLDDPAETIIVVIVLDFAFYGAHVAMHCIPVLWKFHRVHHADLMIDATTAFRQHPVEGAFRYAVIGGVAMMIGASPASFAIYRLMSAVNAVLEHSNVAAPLWVNKLTAAVTTWPHFHKIHHSQVAVETDSNYGNLLSVWDRVFGTATPVERAYGVTYGLGPDAPEAAGLVNALIRPFAARNAPELQ